jgi:predicted enzyme related to lactoylglutathione lyase
VSKDKANRPQDGVPGAGQRPSVALVEFPADDPDRALRFWRGLLDVELEPRREGEGSGWQSQSSAPPVGVHDRGRGPGDSFSLPYFAVDDLPSTLAQVGELGGSVVHPGEKWAICKDSEGNPFGLAARAAQPAVSSAGG